jgi:hypothetical protein
MKIFVAYHILSSYKVHGSRTGVVISTRLICSSWRWDTRLQFIHIHMSSIRKVSKPKRMHPICLVLLNETMRFSQFNPNGWAHGTVAFFKLQHRIRNDVVSDMMMVKVKRIIFSHRKAYLIEPRFRSIQV